MIVIFETIYVAARRFIMRGRRVDITNKRFGSLVAISFKGTDHKGNAIWHCHCDCGNEVDVPSRYLLSGTKISCGCKTRYVRSYEDLTRNRYGRLTVVRLDHIDKNGHSHWLCKCDCGNFTVVQRSHLKWNTTVSCGCYRTELSRIKPSEKLCNAIQNGQTVTAVRCKPIYTRFGPFFSKDRIFKEYVNMVSRCYKETNDSYKHYRAMNVTVCSRWFDPSRVKNGDPWYRDEIGIANFINDMYEEYKRHEALHGARRTTLDRIIGDNGEQQCYSPDTCRWATPRVQNNNLSSNRHIYDGTEILTFSECVRKYIPNDLIECTSYADKVGSIITTKLCTTYAWSVNQVLKFLQIAKAEHRLVCKQELIEHYMIRKIDQTIVYEKYPNEKRLPGYENV